MNIYDRILKEIFMSRRSEFVSRLAGQQPDMPATGEIGGMLGYHVDYFAQLDRQSHLHVEFQTAVDTTMHWRMVNYYVLLHKFAHRWKDASVTVRQVLIYLGSKESRMLEEHPHFGEPYHYKTINLAYEDPEKYAFLRRSVYYGDWLLWLLIGNKTIDEWKRCFFAICRLQDDDDKIMALFNLAHIAPLRDYKDEVQEWVRQMNITEALGDSGIGYGLVIDAAKESVIAVAERYLASIDEDPLDDDELSSLMVMDQDTLTTLVMEFVSGRLERRMLRYAHGMRP